MANQYLWAIELHIDRPDVEAGYSRMLRGELTAEPGEALETAVLTAAKDQLEEMRRALTTIGEEPKPSIAEAATEESPEDAAKRLAGELRRERDRADKAEERALKHARRISALEGEASALVEALTSAGFPLPWWLTAARALDNLDRLARQGVCFHEITPTAP